MSKKPKKIIKSSVRQSVMDLISQARKSYKQGNKVRSKRYIQMALDLIKKHKIRLPKELKNSFCKKCMLIWIPGDTIRVVYDKKNAYLRLTCDCGHSKRI